MEADEDNGTPASSSSSSSSSSVSYRNQRSYTMPDSSNSALAGASASPQSSPTSSGDSARRKTAASKPNAESENPELQRRHTRSPSAPTATSAHTNSSEGKALPDLTLRRRRGPSGDNLPCILSPARLAELEVEMSKEYFLNCILKDESARELFKRFLEALHCAENLSFWLEVEDYMKQDDPEELRGRAKRIYEEYIKPGAQNEVNLSHKMREEVEQRMENPQKDTFTNAQKSIFLLMVHGTFDYFLRSDLYKMYKENRESGVITSRKNTLTKKDEETFELAAAAVAANKGCCILS